jgi:hypothetical protein
MQQERCHWYWTYVLVMIVREVALTLVLMRNFITPLTNTVLIIIIVPLTNDISKVCEFGRLLFL